MLPDDIFRTRLEETIVSLRAWKGFVADVADIEEIEVDNVWRFHMVPRQPNACPLELQLRQDQRFDLVIDDEVFEDRPVVSLDLFLPLVQAVADGRVVKRQLLSAATGLLHATETIVTLGDGSMFADRRLNSDAPALRECPVEWRNIHYLPYRR